MQTNRVVDDNVHEAYSQACNMIRHYSNLRFAMTTVFIAITGGLMVLAFGGDSNLPARTFGLIRIGGVIIAVIFGIAEIRVAKLVEFYRQCMEQFEGSSGVLLQLSNPPAILIWKWLASALMLGLNLLAIIFWLFAEAP